MDIRVNINFLLAPKADAAKGWQSSNHGRCREVFRSLFLWKTVNWRHPNYWQSRDTKASRTSLKAPNYPCRRDLKEMSAKDAVCANFNDFINIFPYSSTQRLNQPVHSSCCLGLVLVLLYCEATQQTRQKEAMRKKGRC